MATTADGTGTLGPGELTIGETGTLIDISCLVNNVSIVPDISEGDSKTMLCGTSKRSADTITWAIEGNVDVDAGLASGFFALTWQTLALLFLSAIPPALRWAPWLLASSSWHLWSWALTIMAITSAVISALAWTILTLPQLSPMGMLLCPWLPAPAPARQRPELMTEGAP
jgi:hypothetical protein